MRALKVALVTVVLTAGPSLSAAAASVPEPVAVNPAVDALDPAGTENHVAWTTNRAATPDQQNVVFMDRGSVGTSRLNAVRTQAGHPRAILGSESIVYQQYTRDTSDIYLYNMDTLQRAKLGAKVNTGKWEYWPAASATYVLFMRYTNEKTKRQLLLYNRSTKTIRTLAEAPASCGSCLVPDWVGQTHAIYSKCSANTYACKVKVATIGGATQTVPGAAAPYTQYGASMDEPRGDVYFVSATTFWGLFVELDRWNIGGGTPVLIHDLAEGVDANSVAVAPSRTVPGDVDLFFSQWDVLKSDADVYEIDSANQVTGGTLTRWRGEVGPVDSPDWAGGHAPVSGGSGPR